MNNIWIYWGAREAWTSRQSLESNCLYFPFEDLNQDFTHSGNETLIRMTLQEANLPNDEYLIQSLDLLTNGMKKGDWIIIPGKFDTLYHMGEIQSDYSFKFDEDYGLHHSRKVDWFVKNVPSSALPLSLAESFVLSKKEPILLNEKQALSFRNVYGMASGF